MRVPVSTVRSNRGPLVATAVPAGAGIRAVGRARSGVLPLLAPGATATVLDWASIYLAEGCSFGVSGLVCNYEGAWDVHVMYFVSTAAEDVTPAAPSDFVLTWVDTYESTFGSPVLDGTGQIREPIGFYGTGRQVHPSPSVPLHVAEGGAIVPSIQNNTNDSLYVQVELSAHYIGDSGFEP